MSDGQVRYARNGDVHLAYRVFGDSGPVVVWVPGWVVGNVDTYGDPASPYQPLIELFSQETQFVVYDKRGAGLSDPVTNAPSLTERIGDLRAVCDAVEAAHPILMGTGEGGPISILFAVTYPDRVDRLLLYATAARFSAQPPDFPWGFTPDQIAAQLDDIEKHWGEGALAELFHGDVVDLPGVRQLFGKLQRSIASPHLARLWWQALMEIDVRDVLDKVRAPALVCARSGDRFVSFEATAALAAGIPNARFLEFPPGPHNAFDILREVVPIVLDLTFERAGAPVDERVLKTVMFTDIVSSTEQLGKAGDTRWRHQLDIHDSVVDHILSQYGGVRAKHTGDGVFALFDGPTRAVRCALALMPSLAARGIRIRAGVHVGECVRRGEEWSGMAVHTGARIGALASAGEVLTSRTVRDLSAGSGLAFEYLGPQCLKGLPEDVDVYRVTSTSAYSPYSPN
ncbi:adenylate/guanylate cyclase domain-containing protein [Mycolicibacterium sp. ND9-15]|uniref:adenylate/guanylate cyclase domain-containing protein n=1 Tax=Mycolicibacterium sp. ND9-15 TaxID=3042320 RepID=UPI002DDAA1F6|nr:adenylate/guanylate cyclase domain-containing protein [Mycolicibacterium sp. ND9-15]WSE58110.1 adenylate/guanylate cyclase domain-containing protein [Mycolicibacterium sp. ND9-15]